MTRPEEEIVGEAELKRLRELGARLDALAREVDGTIDPEERARMQDANLAAFELMTDRVGRAAFTRLTEELDRLERTLSEGGSGAAAASEAGAGFAAASKDIAAEREAAMRRLYNDIADRLREAKNDFEPFA